jgi:SAM-dependent methyltransferase
MSENSKTSVPIQDLENAWARIKEYFPFKDYIRESRKSGYFQMVRKVVKWSNRDAKVLDFGAGPCDKTGLFSLIGMEVTAFDTLEDKWHKLNNNREKIIQFANRIGIDYYLADGGGGFTFPDKQYDIIMLHNVIEHLHSSPRSILNKLLPYLKPRGILSITVPNAANLRKRIHLLLGKTNYNRFEYFYWYPGLWQGHIREYVKNDLLLLNKFLGLKLIELTSYHLQLDALPQRARELFVGFTYFFPGCRDSWMLIARKPPDWQPRFKPNPKQFENAFGNQYYDYSNADFDWEE